jgi:hypothetical protein
MLKYKIIHFRIVLTPTCILLDFFMLPSYFVYIVIQIEPNSTSKPGSKGRIVQSYINPHTGFMTSDVGLQVGFMKPNLHMEIGNK